MNVFFLNKMAIDLMLDAFLVLLWNWFCSATGLIVEILFCWATGLIFFVCCLSHRNDILLHNYKDCFHRVNILLRFLLFFTLLPCSLSNVRFLFVFCGFVVVIFLFVYFGFGFKANKKMRKNREKKCDKLCFDRLVSLASRLWGVGLLTRAMPARVVQSVVARGRGPTGGGGKVRARPWIQNDASRRR